MIDKFYDIEAVNKKDKDRVAVHSTSSKVQAVIMAKNIDKFIDECWEVVVFEVNLSKNYTKTVHFK